MIKKNRVSTKEEQRNFSSDESKCFEKIQDPWSIYYWFCGMKGEKQDVLIIQLSPFFTEDVPRLTWRRQGTMENNIVEPQEKLHTHACELPQLH